ncbi:lipase family protein [Nocardia sp. NPDC020380]|uniref:lipase family protein n=1 Tax=Nocardia sp. NPDC020380 TaxID=3364309 RepID=UPI003791B3A2
MRPNGIFATQLAITLSATAALFVLPGSPAHAEPTGALISATAQPDGWHDQTGGSLVEYWSTRSNGEPVRESGALFVPQGTPPPGGWPIMAWDHGTTGMGAGCGGQSQPEIGPQPEYRAMENQVMRYFLSRGIAVAAPDYLGLGLYDTGPHPYLELRTEATSTLDMVRAAREAEPTLSRTWAVTGESQGGQAALGTAHWQVGAAPDLDFRGTIAVDPESDVEKVLPPVSGPWLPALPGSAGADVGGFFTSILAGVRAARPDAQVDSYLTDQGRQILDSIGTLCLPQIKDIVSKVALGDLIARPLSEGPLPGVLNDYLTVPTRGYNAPILLLLNATDTTVPSPLHAALVAQFAANGVDFRAIPGLGEHVVLNDAMWAGIAQFTDRFLATPTVR